MLGVTLPRRRFAEVAGKYEHQVALALSTGIEAQRCEWCSAHLQQIVWQNFRDQDVLCHSAVRAVLSPASTASKGVAAFAGLARLLEPDMVASGTARGSTPDGVEASWRWCGLARMSSKH